jgi:hypothetical protein
MIQTLLYILAIAYFVVNGAIVKTLIDEIAERNTKDVMICILFAFFGILIIAFYYLSEKIREALKIHDVKEWFQLYIMRDVIKLDTIEKRQNLINIYKMLKDQQRKNSNKLWVLNIRIKRLEFVAKVNNVKLK